MKAYLIIGKTRKEVDVVYIGSVKQKWYKDKNTNAAYPSDALEFKEYCGG